MKSNNRYSAIYSNVAIACSVLTLAGGMPRADALTITSAELTGPGSITKGGKGTFTWTLKGTGAGATGTDLVWSVYDLDSVSDDLLIDETLFGVSGDNFTKTETFELECTADCFLKGASGQTDEPATGPPKDAQVFVLFETPTLGINVARSNTLQVKCVHDAGSSLGLLGSGLLALALFGSRRRKQAA